MDSNSDLDRALSAEPNVVPSAAFARNVMAAVYQEASTPAAITFPWGRAVPGLAICAIALTAFMVLVVVQLKQGAGLAGPFPSVVVDAIQYAHRFDLGWITLALFASFVPWRIARARR